MVNFGPLAAEILSLVRSTPGTFDGFRVLAALLHRTLVVGVSQNAALNRGRHLYSAGRPSRWALAHISSFFLSIFLSIFFSSPNLSGHRLDLYHTSTHGVKNRNLCTIAQLCRAISSQLRHVSTIGKKLVKQQYLLYISPTIW